MKKILKNYQTNNQDKIAIQSKTIEKKAKSNTSNSDEVIQLTKSETIKIQKVKKISADKAKEIANARERARSKSMKILFNNLANKIMPSAHTQGQILDLSKKYVEFLYQVRIRSK